MAIRAERARLPRFTRTERAVHWVHASAFLVLLATGLILYLPNLSQLVNRRPLVKSIHLYTAVAWAIALAIVATVGNRQALRATAREINLFDSDDWQWLRLRHTPQGRLNAGQKLNAIATAAFTVLFAITGFFLWYGERDHRFRLANALLVHDWLTYVSVILLSGHLFLALIYPRTRHALSGITRGWVDEDWAQQHHSKWAEGAKRDVQRALVPPEPK